MSRENVYPVEVKIISKSGWFTPAEGKNYYGRYGRDGITVHWWGDNTGADNHDNIVNYFASQSANGVKSVNYVLSDNKISCLVSPDNVAWASQSGNATTISVETQPTLGPEGYKKWGWLIDQLEQRYGKTLPIYPHSYWFSTACPGTLDLNRIRQEANKWRTGQYDTVAPAKPVPPVVRPNPVPPPTVTLEIIDIPNKTVELKQDANLWDLHFSKWADAKVVKTLKAKTQIEVSATAKHPLGGTYYLSEYSFKKGIGNGINVKDCSDITVSPTTDPPVITPVPIPTKLPTIDERLSALEKLVNAILAALTKIGVKV